MAQNVISSERKLSSDQAKATKKVKEKKLAKEKVKGMLKKIAITYIRKQLDLDTIVDPPHNKHTLFRINI